MSNFIIACFALMAMQLALAMAADTSYGCGRLKDTNACDIRPQSELDSGTVYEEVDPLMCWGLSQGRENQACNEFKKNTLCQRDCVEPICWKFNRPCPNNEINKGEVLLGYFNDKCWAINTGARIALFYNRTPSRSDGEAVPNSICDGLIKNKVYKYPCQKDAIAERMEKADNSTAVCGNCGNEYKRFKSLQSLLIYNCLNSTAQCEVTADSNCE